MNAGTNVIDGLLNAPSEEVLYSAMRGETMSPLLITFVNPYSYQLLRDHAQLIRAMDALYADGIALAKVATFLGGARVPRRSFDMTSMAGPVFERCVAYDLSLGVVGAKHGEVDIFRQYLQQEYPGIRCVVARSGYFASENERNDAIRELAAKRVELVVCGMGTLLQEQFLVDVKREVPSLRVGITCGGFIHQSARSLEYYPRAIDALELRWAYRLMREPNTWSRFLRWYPRFIRTFVRDWMSWRNELPGSGRC